MFTYEFSGATNSVPHPEPLGRLDKSMSLRVGDFAQENYPPPKYPRGGGPSGLPLIKPLSIDERAKVRH